MVRNCWNVEVKGHQYNIEIQSNTIVGNLATGGGRLLVNGEIVRDWGCNPFAVIPKGRLDVELAGKKAWIVTKGGFTNYLVLVLDAQEVLSIVFKS
jgi:hypothetical protein